MENIGLESLLRQYITNAQNSMFTAIPGRIERVVSLPEQRVDVRPIVNRVKPDDTELEHPVALSVPLVFPGSNTSQFSFPVSVGDTVLMIFSQRSIQRFKLGAKDVHRPIDLAKYSRNDAMAIPGLFTFPEAKNNPSKRSLNHSTDDAVMVHNIGTSAECEVRLKASGDIVINAPGNDVSINCDTANINASSSTTIDTPQTTVTGDMLVQGTFTYTSGMIGSGTAGGSTASITGSVSVTGDVTAGGISVMNHAHTGDSGGTTSPPNS